VTFLATDEQTHNERVVIGRAVTSHGLQGTLKVEPLTEFPERFAAVKRCYLVRPDGEELEVRLKRVKPAGNILLLNFDAVKTREAADYWRGATVEIPAQERWKLPEDWFYVSDLVGCRAVNEGGQEIGLVEQVIRASQDILIIRVGTQELLVPFVNEWVGRTDTVARIVEIKRAKELLGAEELPPEVGEGDH